MIHVSSCILAAANTVDESHSIKECQYFETNVLIHDDTFTYDISLQLQYYFLLSSGNFKKFPECILHSHHSDFNPLTSECGESLKEYLWRKHMESFWINSKLNMQHCCNFSKIPSTFDIEHDILHFEHLTRMHIQQIQC